MDKSHLGVISSTDLIDSKLEEHQMCGSKQCPSCGHRLENKPDWLGLPAGVKFDPSDQELIEHLEAKVEGQDSKSHPLIDEFIPTIQGEDGICYTHPEKLPGVTRDGLSRHFFHRPSKAYTTGTRKRRKIQTECDLQGGETRWHKTGKTRPVMVNGKQKGCKKILVLYTNFGKHKKPEKTNWVMHQYHLGQSEEEKEGELVVSKIFYQTQPRQCNWSERSSSTGEHMGSEKHREVSGSIKCCSSNDGREREDSSGAGMSSYSPMDVQQVKSDNFSFAPFRKSFDEVGIGEGAKNTEGSNRCNPSTCEEHEEHKQQISASSSTATAATRPPFHMTHDQHHHHHRHQQQVATAAFNISRPSNPISTIIAPPLQQTTMVLNDPTFHVSRLLLQNEKFQQLQQQQPEQKLVDRPGSASHKLSSLEEIFMHCTSSEMKELQEAEWLKYSFWPDPDNPDHHG